MTNVCVGHKDVCLGLDLCVLIDFRLLCTKCIFYGLSSIFTDHIKVIIFNYNYFTMLLIYFLFQAKANEAELQNQWANNRMTKRQTQSKYGF